MFARNGAEAAMIAAKIAQKSNQARMIQISSLSCKDKTIIDQAKQGAQTIVDKAKDTVEAVKEKVMGSSSSGHTSTGSSSIKGEEGDPRGSHKHVKNIIDKNDEEFSTTDKKLGHSGNTHGRGGYDPKTV